MGTVVQIHPDQRALGGCFGVVTSVHQWGVSVDVPVARNSIAPVRLNHEEFAVIGTAEWVPVDQPKPAVVYGNGGDR